MCDHSPNREAAMTVLSSTVWCDPCIAPLIKALNAGGIPTTASCCGHGEYAGWVMLADGRDLIIAPDHRTGRALQQQVTEEADHG